MSIAIGIVILGCLFGCYFSACNVVLKSLSRKRLADRLGQSYSTTRLAQFFDRLPHMILLTGTIRMAMSLVVLLATLYHLEGRLDGFSRLQIDLIAFVVAGCLVSIFCVAIPVSWGRYHRESLIAISLPLLSLLLLLLKPLVSVLHLFDPVIRRISGADLGDQQDSELTDHVLSIVEEHEDGQDVDDAQKEMLEAVFDLSNASAEQIMTPRTDVFGIEVGSSLNEVKDAIIEHGHSRIPVYDQSIDNIVGILYAKDLIRFLGDGEEFTLRSVLREAMMVPESKNAGELLAEFKARKVHLAIVLDEYGGTAGLVTIEDILEELVGEIQDEYEQADEEPQIHRVDAQTVWIDARMEIDDLNDELDLELPEDDDYETVGGFVFATLGHIPKAGESFEYEGMGFTVTDAERTRVVRVELKLPEPMEATAEPDTDAQSA